MVTEFNEWNAEISPDGLWMAYQSNASGQDEIYVQPFPDVDTGRWQISRGGGRQPLWGPDGRELFYRTTVGVVMAVSVQPDPSFVAGNPAVVFEGSYFVGPAGRTYDISPDGQQFLMIKEGAQATDSAAPAQLVLVQNWFEELKQIVPVP